MPCKGMFTCPRGEDVDVLEPLLCCPPVFWASGCLEPRWKGWGLGPECGLAFWGSGPGKPLLGGPW